MYTGQPTGGPSCNNLGYRGRLGIFEVWQLTEEDYGRILKHEDEHSLRQALNDRGQQMMLDDGMAKVESGETTFRELLRTGVMFSGLRSAE